MRKKHWWILGLLILCLLGTIVYHYGNWARKTGAQVGETIFPLERTDPLPIGHSHITKGLLSFSPDGKYLVVSSADGNLSFIEINKQKTIYRQNLGIGFFSALAFSPEGKHIYIGENSPDGYLYCLTFPKGDLVWKYKTSAELGVNLALQSYPNLYRIVLDGQGNLYGAAGRIESRSTKNRPSWSRIYCWEGKTGKLLWKFPAEENLDCNTHWLDVDQRGKGVVFATSSYPKESAQKYPSSALYYLDAKKGEQLWQQVLKPEKPFQKVSLQYTPSISPDGKKVGILTGQGQAYLFTAEGRELWRRTISSVKDIQGIPLYAFGSKSDFQQQKLILLSSSTYNASQSTPSNYQQFPLEHPNSNSIFAYNDEGNLLWKWKAQGYIKEINFSSDGSYLCVPVTKNFRQQSLQGAGVYLLNVAQEKVELVKEFHAQSGGGFISAVLSSDGKYLAALEEPVLLADGVKVQGKYQIHLWRLK